MQYLNNFVEYVKNLYFSANYLQAGLIIALIFLLVVTLAQVRHHYVKWSLKGSLMGLFFGFLLVLLLEGFFLIAGKTLLTETIGWENAPKPIKTALDIGRNKLINVLGVSSEIPYSVASIDPNIEDAIDVLQSLDPSESKKIKAIICQP
jgi:hypothetical protein